MSLTAKPPPGRDPGRRQGQIRVNCLRITPPTRGTYYHYDVVFSDTVSTRAKAQLIDTLLNTYRDDIPTGSAFDGEKNLFCPEDLRNGPSQTFPVTIGRTTSSITLTRVSVIQPSTFGVVSGSTPKDIGSWNASEGQRLPAITLLNVLVRVGPMRARSWVSKGRALYSDQGFEPIRGTPLELWRGYFQSVRHTIRGLTLNLDNTMTVMYKRGQVLEVLLSEFQAHERGGWDIANFKYEFRRGGSAWKKVENRARRFLKGVKVTRNYQLSKHKNKSFTIQDIIPQSAVDYLFEMDGQELSVADYFERVLRERLQYPQLPLLVKYKNAAIPLEKLDIVAGQAYKGLVSEAAKTYWLGKATMEPKVRLEQLKHAQRELDYPNSSYLSQAGIRVDDQFLSINTRALRQPVLAAGDSGLIQWDGRDPDVKIDVGSWSMQKRRVYRPARVYKVVFVSMADRFSIVQNQQNQMLLRELERVWHSMGISFHNPPLDSFHDYQGSDPTSFLDQLLNNDPSRPRHPSQGGDKDEFETKMSAYLVVVIVNLSDKQKRESIKWWGDVSAGWVTQILRVNKLKPGKSFDQYARNVGLKVNAKMRGINVVPRDGILRDIRVGDIRDPVTMIVGIDTSHPPPGSQAPSTAAMVYSVDRHYVDYRAEVRFQPARQEMVKDMFDMMQLALVDFVKQTGGREPQLIVIYRDGVSEGQFRQVLDIEVAQIRAAIDFCWSTYNVTKPKPKLILTVVGKKHHIRFFPDTRGQMADRTGNAIPGTVIDDEITTADPQVFDYYLQSHGAILGTSRPAHYSILIDEVGLNADQHETISYSLCHLYQIATRSVSTPAPVYYADKVAGRFDIQWYGIKNSLETMSQLSADSMEYHQYEAHFGNVEVRKQTKRRMYWL